jgi:arylsulfatase A-like enzyme
MFSDGSDHGWQALHDVSAFGVRDGRLAGHSGELPLLISPTPENLDTTDLLHAVELRIRVSEGGQIGVDFDSEDELDRDALIARALDNDRAMLSTELIAGDEIQTYTLTTANSQFDPSFPFGQLKRIMLRPTDTAGATFELESVRLISRKEHLAQVPSGLGWHGLRDVYRETLVSRAPERIAFDLALPSEPYLELFLGTIDDAPVRFEAEVSVPGTSPVRLFRRTLSSARRWERVTADLTAFAGRDVTLRLSLDAQQAGAIGFWGGPVVRNRAGSAVAGDSSPARAAVAGEAPAPQGVVLILIDTLRRDHLQAYGHQRDSAPVLSRIAREGALFRDAISQGTWTKVAATSILTSLYPSTHGVSDMPDRIPATVTTLAEAYRAAGYATFATSSVPFTGKLTNLQQGVDVQHERASLDEIGGESAKTARAFTDRLLRWIDERGEEPFFALLHVFDPHSPFEPMAPYERLWMDDTAIAQHRKDMAAVGEHVESPFMKREGALPSQSEMDASGVDQARYLKHEKIWYDASIRAMDVEVGRLMERLEERGLDERTLVAVVSDHGEEFLEHGRHFHGKNAYGEMINVPLMLWWPGVIPATEVATTVETINLMPTLLELSRIDVPEIVQGQSLLPLLAKDTRADQLGWQSRPAFSERALAPAAFNDGDPGRACLAIVDGDWKLIHNTEGRADLPEYELYDHRIDPLDRVDVAAQHPEVVELLKIQLAGWHEMAVGARVEPTADAELSAEELQQLRALGYMQ